MRRMRAVMLGLLLTVPASGAFAAEANFGISCAFDQDESGTDPAGTVADGLGGTGVSVAFDFAAAIGRYRDGSIVHLTKVDADTIEYQESEYTITYHRDSGDLISHDNKTNYDATFHCARFTRRN